MGQIRQSMCEQNSYRLKDLGVLVKACFSIRVHSDNYYDHFGLLFL